ncbi:MAG TPA: serine/threonine-protein kinase [Gemmatimonadaceae bacterium]|nr:serine/threonine-protein kinase [Gemmatimonadaceae bacterium]
MTADLGARLQEHLGAHYTIERELGGGGMSRVFVARDNRLNRRVVFKVLLPSLAATVSVDRFQREIMVSASLQHPHIVPVLDAGEVGGEGGGMDGRLPYFVMPYVDGESLRSRIVRGPLAVREVASILKDVARALAFAHARGIIHRDIKPDNILLAAQTAVVTDFGVAKALDSARLVGRETPRGAPPVGAEGRAVHGMTITGIGISLGTPAYMAPEQAAADPNTDHRADIYSLGTVAYEMLVGAPPFHGRNRQALLTAQLSELPPPLAARRYDVPVALVDLVMHCLEKEPTDRPKSANEVVRALENPDVVSGPVALPPAAREKRRRRWWTVAMPAAVAGAVAVAGIAAWWRWTSAAQTPSAAATADDTAAAAAAVSPVPAAASTLTHAVAVLPLASTSGDARDAGIALGLTAELTNAVSRLPGLRVASQTAAAAAARGRAGGGAQSLGEIGAALGVTMLVEGTVQRAGDRVRATVQLVSVRNDSTLWAGRFDGRAGDIFAMQDSLTRAVTGAVTAQVGGGGGR